MNINPIHIFLAGCVVTISGLFMLFPLGKALLGTGIVLFITSAIAAVNLGISEKSTSQCQQRPPPTPNSPPRKP